MAKECKTHKRKYGFNDPVFDSKLANLPGNQGLESRHACAYCAYKLGIKEERIRIAKKLGKSPNDLL